MFFNVYKENNILELNLIKLLLQGSNYNLYFGSIDLAAMRENYPELHYIYRSLDDLHQKHPDKDFSIDELSSYFFVKYPDAKKETYTDLFDRAQAAQIDDEVGASILQQIKQRQRALKLSEVAFAFTQGRSSSAALAELVAGFETEEEVVNDIVGLDLDLDSLLDGAVRTSGLRWRLDFLNKSLGSLRAGDFGFIMKRPETGGTAFLASEVSYMLDQTDQHIIWINNEEQDNKVAIRIYQAYFGITLSELLANATRYKAAFKQRVGDKLKFFGIEHSNKESITKINRQYKPALIVYDQIDKILGFEADRDDLRLGAIYQFVREECKAYGAAIGVTQADGTAEGVKYLNMGHTANSKTSKAAEADFILGLGKSHNPNEENSRFISICKNKLFGDSDTLPQFRHGHMEVLIKPQIMRFEDVISYG